MNIDGAYVGLSVFDNEADAGNMVKQMSTDDNMSWGFAARMTRDYGMFERDQAPQDYPPVEPGKG